MNFELMLNKVLVKPMDVWITLLVIATLIAMAMVSYFAFSRKYPRLPMIFFGLSWAGTLFLLGNLWLHYGAPPLGTIYHVILATAVVFFPLALLICTEKRRFTLPALLLSGLVPVLAALFMQLKLDWRPVPILQSAWFTPHVFAYSVAYGIALSAFMLSFVYLFRSAMRWNTEVHFTTIRILILMAFPFFIFGLCSGMLWGNTAWGSYWGWDPKEVWGLITVLLYTLFLHYAQIPNQRTYAIISQILAFIALIITCFVVAFTTLGAGSMHSYGS